MDRPTRRTAPVTTGGLLTDPKGNDLPVPSSAEAGRTRSRVEIGETSRTCTGTNAVTGRDAVVTSWSP